jgi:ELWxxDGT repeat protein
VEEGGYFFAADDGTHGREPWVSDGTPAGTRLVKDALPGGQGSRPGRFLGAGDRVYFVGTADTRGRELWVTDGTAQGTLNLTSFGPSPYRRGDPGYPDDLTAVDRRLFFTADDFIHGRELWTSDGTPAGTRLVADLAADARDAPIGRMAAFRGQLFFDYGYSHEFIFSSDGTAAGTVARVHDARANGPMRATRRFLFYVSDLSRLVRTDGDDSGTVLVKDFDGDALDIPVITEIASAGDRLFLALRRGRPQERSELWVTDGTPEGTRWLKDFGPPGFRDGFLRSVHPTLLTEVGEGLFFIVDNGIMPRYELWTSDGTVEGTVRLKELPRDLTPIWEPRLVPSGHRVFLALEARQLWVSDRTPVGTVLLRDFAPGQFDPSTLESVGESLLFVATPEGCCALRQLWTSDGTVQGTRPIRDFRY